MNFVFKNSFLLLFIVCTMHTKLNAMDMNYPLPIFKMPERGTPQWHSIRESLYGRQNLPAVGRTSPQPDFSDLNRNQLAQFLDARDGWQNLNSSEKEAYTHRFEQLAQITHGSSKIRDEAANAHPFCNFETKPSAPLPIPNSAPKPSNRIEQIFAYAKNNKLRLASIILMVDSLNGFRKAYQSGQWKDSAGLRAKLHLITNNIYLVKGTRLAISIITQRK